MNNIYEQLKDLHIRNIVVFGKAEDSKLYKESTYKTQLKEEELQELFSKGMLLINTDDDVYEVAVKVNANKAYTVTATTVESATTLSLTEWAAEAAE